MWWTASVDLETDGTAVPTFLLTIFRPQLPHLSSSQQKAWRKCHVRLISKVYVGDPYISESLSLRSWEADKPKSTGSAESERYSFRLPTTWVLYWWGQRDDRNTLNRTRYSNAVALRLRINMESN